MSAAPASRTAVAAVLAHPDDESRIVGGTLALAAARGWQVSLYCATRGEAGDPRRPGEHVAALREGELRTACDLLGIHRVWLDGFPDNGLADADAEVLVERIVRFLRTVRPHAVISFGPDGRTGHRDHVVVGRLAGVAFGAAADPDRYPHQAEHALDVWQPGWLYQTAVARSVGRRIGWPHPVRPDEDLLAIDVSPVLERKRRAAVEAHASQWGLSPMNLTQGWEAWSVEHFRLTRTASTPACTDPLAELAGRDGSSP